MMKTLSLCAAALAVTVSLTGCINGDAEAAQGSLTVDRSLTGDLVTTADFTAGWNVQDISDKMAESGKKSSGKASPAECDSSDTTSLTSGVGAMVTEGQGPPGAIATLSHQLNSTLIRDTEQWLSRCQRFTVDADKATADVSVRRIDVPATTADTQIGWEMSTTSTAQGESVSMTVRGYTAQVGDVVVLCMTMGGKASSGGAPGVVPNVAMLDTVYAKQVEKIRNP